MKEKLITNLAPTGIFSLLLNDNPCFNGSTLKALIKMQSFYQQFWQASLPFFRNVL
jgi:hypothetical protein